MPSPATVRVLTFVAAGVLGFDGAALAALGVWTHHTVLLVVGVALFLSSGLVVAYWRGHQRRSAEILAARREVREEALELRRLLRGE